MAKAKTPKGLALIIAGVLMAGVGIWALVSFAYSPNHTWTGLADKTRYNFCARVSFSATGSATYKVYTNTYKSGNTIETGSSGTTKINHSGMGAQLVCIELKANRNGAAYGSVSGSNISNVGWKAAVQQ